MPFFYKLLIFAWIIQTSDTASFAVMEALYNNLTSGHNKYLRPEKDSSSSTTISMDFYIISLQEISSVDGTVSLTGYFVILWNDITMVWDPSEYENTTYIILPHDQVWKPPLVNSNSATTFKMFGVSDTYLQVFYNGIIAWLPGENLKFSCNIDTSYFPFDTQECDMDIIAWGYGEGDIIFSSSSKTVQTSTYTASSEWDLINTSVLVDNSEIPKVKHKFFLKRRSLFLMVNLILPVVFLALLNICVFFLPHDSGERIGFSITLLLAVVVFLTIAQGMLPASAEPRLSAICIMLLINLFMSGCIVVSVIVSSWFYFKPDEESIPRWIECIVSLQCCRCTSNKSKVENFCVDDQKKPLEPIIIAHSNNNKLNWKQVAKIWDTISLIFYILLFIGGLISFIIDVNS